MIDWLIDFTLTMILEDALEKTYISHESLNKVNMSMIGIPPACN